VGAEGYVLLDDLKGARRLSELILANTPTEALAMALRGSRILELSEDERGVRKANGGEVAGAAALGNDGAGINGYANANGDGGGAGGGDHNGGEGGGEVDLANAGGGGANGGAGGAGEDGPPPLPVAVELVNPARGFTVLQFNILADFCVNDNRAPVGQGKHDYFLPAGALPQAVISWYLPGDPCHSFSCRVASCPRLSRRTYHVIRAT
jgi:hypothetical protein